jgi:hypothetical protein
VAAQEAARVAIRERKQRANAKENKEGERADLIARLAELREQIEATESALDLNESQLKDAGQELRDAERDADERNARRTTPEDRVKWRQ